MSEVASREQIGLSGPLVVGLGEALFDCFADSRHVGGAPVNCAVHSDALLRAVGGQGVVASAVGDDGLGKEFFSFLKARSLASQFVQVDPARATGRVLVSLDEQGEPAYLIEGDVAWDHLQYDEQWKRLACSCQAVCYGTLAQRSSASRQTIVAFLQDARQAIKLLDVNLRQSFYSADLLLESLQLATAAKFNLTELVSVGRMLGLTARETPEIDELANQFLDVFKLDWVAVTRGSAGTALYADHAIFEAATPPIERADKADAVGAGDACGAGLLVSAILKLPYAQRVPLANDMGAFVCSQQGAVPTLPEGIVSRVRNHAAGAESISAVVR